MDDHRKENFAETFPEFYELMESADETIGEDNLVWPRSPTQLQSQSFQDR